MVDGAGVALLYIDGMQNILAANRKAAELTGYSADTLCDMRLHDLTAPEDLRADQIALTQLQHGEAQEKPRCSLEKRLRLPNGQELWVHETVAREEDEDGDMRFVVTMYDITDKKVLDYRISQQQAWLTTALEAATASAFKWDLENDAVEWDENLSRVLGRQVADAPRRTAQLLSLVHPEDRGRLAPALDRIRRRGARALTNDFRILGPGGESRWLRLRAQAIRTADDLPKMLVGTFQDISPSVEASRRGVIGRIAAERADAAKTTFLASINHEMRTPLAVILGVTEQLLSVPESGREIENSLRTIDRNGRQLLAHIENLLSLAEADDPVVPLRLARFDLSALLSEVVATLRPKADAKSLKLLLAVDGDFPQEIISDREKIGRCLGQLVANAVNFTEQGGIRVIARREPRRLVGGAEGVAIVVSDSGVGIPPEQLPCLFQPFRPDDAATLRPGAGCGVGLAVARKLARACYGELGLLSSSPGAGSLFALHLPLAPPSA